MRCSYIPQNSFHQVRNVGWITGEYDFWVNKHRVTQVMADGDGPRTVYNVPTGHLIQSSEDALVAFDLIAKESWRKIFRAHHRPVHPRLSEIHAFCSDEWDRVRKMPTQPLSSYWASYLIGDPADQAGFDILRVTEEYSDLLRDQADLLDLEPGLRIIDLGAGTGNMLDVIADCGVSPLTVHIVDFVQRALGIATRKGTSKGLHVLPALIDLELDRFSPLENILRDDGYRPLTDLTGKIAGADGVALRNLDRAGPIVRKMALGEMKFDKQSIKSSADLTRLELDILEDLNRGSQCIKRRKSDRAFRPLRFDSSAPGSGLPYRSSTFDRILASLLVSYIVNRVYLLREVYRVLKPGGLVVISSLKPDCDMSMAFTRGTEKLRSMPASRARDDALNAAQNCLNFCANIWKLEEEGYFHFFSEKELVDLLRQGGFQDIESQPTGGPNKQAVIARGFKPKSTNC